MARNTKTFVIIIMVWFTAITMWSVNKITDTMGYLNSVHVSGIPVQPVDQPVSTVRIDENTVWVINANSNFIKVITYDEDGYHVTGAKMSYQELQ